jgi:hypothetical protein
MQPVSKKSRAKDKRGKTPDFKSPLSPLSLKGGIIFLPLIVREGVEDVWEDTAIPLFGKEGLGEIL